MRIGYSVTGPGMEEMELREEKRKKGVQAQLLLAQARKNVEESMQRQDREIADRGIRREILIDEQQNGRGQRRLRSSSSDPSLRRGGFGGRRDRDRESLKGGHIDIGGGGKIDQRRLEMIAAEKVRENLRDIDEKAAELEWQRRRIFEEKERRQMMRVREKELRRQRKRERKENKRREKLMSDGSSLSSMSSISSISESSIGSKKGKKLGLFRRGSRKSPLRNSSSMSSLSSDHEPEILEPNTPRNRRFSSDDATSTHRKSTFLSLLFGRNRHKSPHRKPILSSPETQQTHKSSTNTPHRGSIGSIFFDHHTSQKPAKEADPSLAIEAANDPIQPLPIPALSDSRRSTDSSRSSHYHDTHETPQTLDTLPEVDEAGTNGQNEIIVETITETRKSTTDSSGKVIESETVIERDLDVLDLPEFAKLPEFGGEERVRERRERRGKVGKSVGFVEGDVLDVDTTSSTDSTDSTDSDSEEVLDETHQQEDKENNPLGLPEFEKKPKPNPKKKTHKSKGKGKGKAPAIASSSNEAFQSTVPISSKNHEQYEQYSQYGQYTVGHGGAKPVMKDPVGSNPVVPKPVDLSTVYMGLPEFAGKSSTPIKDTGTGASAGTSGYLDLPEFGGGSGGVRDKGKGKEKEVVETPPVQVADEKSNFLTLPEFGGREKSSFDSGRESRFTEGL
ncbi:hypothetical protein BZA77DRAFT_323983 [Pyronema omphalodes]|nr:hypothetical protein BZA77DRAFT_323983 [Pyronema omphalodes]